MGHPGLWLLRGVQALAGLLGYEGDLGEGALGVGGWLERCWGAALGFEEDWFGRGWGEGEVGGVDGFSGVELCVRVSGPVGEGGLGFGLVGGGEVELPVFT